MTALSANVHVVRMLYGARPPAMRLLLADEAQALMNTRNWPWQRRCFACRAKVVGPPVLAPHLRFCNVHHQSWPYLRFNSFHRKSIWRRARLGHSTNFFNTACNNNILHAQNAPWMINQQRKTVHVDDGSLANGISSMSMLHLSEVSHGTHFCVLFHSKSEASYGTCSPCVETSPLHRRGHCWLCHQYNRRSRKMVRPSGVRPR